MRLNLLRPSSLKDRDKRSGDPMRDDEITIAYQPILRGAAIASLCYFMFDLATRLIWPDAEYHGVMVTSVGIATLVSLGIRRYLMSPRSALQLEASGGLLCALMYLNSNLQQVLYFQVENLIYSVLMIPLFAAMLPRRRSIAISTVLCLTSLLGLVAWNLPHQFSDYMWIGFSGIAAGIAISLIIRTAVLNAVKARLEAVRDRETAERLAREARHLAECDALTQLPNRRSFFLALNQRVQRLRDAGTPFILGLVDLDGFKPVNDTYGHAAGDEMLKVVADRLTTCLGSDALAARLGGDEFALLAPCEPNTPETALALGQDIEALLSEPYKLGDYTCKGSASVGLLLCDDPALESRAMMERADHALYFAKRALQGKAVLFNEALEQEMSATGKVDRALRRADHASEFEVYFQPQLDLPRSRLVGFEALARWNSPELGAITPDVFIPAAERAGLIRPLTRIFLGKALAAMSDWPADLKLSFNLSTLDLMSPNAIDTILDTVAKSGIAPERIEFEITETAMMSDFGQARQAIGRIHDAGHPVALDDFGIGYSSLQYLQQLPVNKLKIDHSFVRNILDDTSSFKIVRTLLSLAQTLGLNCVVEGVETPAQLQILKTMGARLIQGYLIGKPMPASEIPSFLERRIDTSPIALQHRVDVQKGAA